MCNEKSMRLETWARGKRWDANQPRGDYAFSDLEPNSNVETLSQHVVFQQQLYSTTN